MNKTIEARQSHKALYHVDNYLANIQTEVRLARNMIRKHIADDLKRIRKSDKVK